MTLDPPTALRAVPPPDKREGADLSALAAPLVGTPYRHRAPEYLPPYPGYGWDCLGLVGWCRLAWGFGCTPGWDEDFEKCRGLTGRALSQAVSQEIWRRTASWRPVMPRPGAVLLLNTIGIRDHVGLMLNDRSFLHVVPEGATRIDDLDANPWRRRIVGCFDTKLD